MTVRGDFSGVDDRQLVADAVSLAERETALTAQRLACLAEIERRKLALRLRSSTVSRWWANGMRVTDGAARRQVELGRWLTEWPVVQRAFENAEIHLWHVSALVDGLGHVVAADPDLSDDDRTAVVEDLLRVASTGTAPNVQRRATTLALSAAADAQRRADAARAAEQERQREQDQNHQGHGRDEADEKSGGEADAASPEQSPDAPEGQVPPPIPPAENADLNRLSIHPLANGRSQIDGNIDVLLAEKLKNALAPHSAPRPGPNGERDERSPAKRTADALSDVLDQTSGGGQRPVFAGIVHLGDLVRRDPADDTYAPSPGANHPPTEPNPADRPTTSPPDHGTAPPAYVPPTGDLFRDDWPFHLAWAGPISRALAELVTCDADMTPIIVDGAGVPLAMGRTERYATPAQRTAVIVRDRCCIMCGRPPRAGRRPVVTGTMVRRPPHGALGTRR